ncbi:hypothetical protein SAMN02910339_00467 [Lachnospiraceae bacterium YSD2013]|nr:hypothetical protein SAMN02910339_00467 [Lachnospiraceae bacterium YSD2013]
MKIVFIFCARHYYNYDDEQFGLNFLREKGHEIEIWSAVNWRYYPKIIEVPRNVHSGELIYIDSSEELEKRLNLIPRDEKVHFIVYAYHDYCKVTEKIRALIVKHGFCFSNLTEASDIVEVRFHKTKLFYLFKECYRILQLLVYGFRCMLPKCSPEIVERRDYFLSSLRGPLLYKSQFNFVRCRNAYNYFPNYLEVFSKRNVIIPHTDYTYYLKNKEIEQEKPIAVFIDEYEIGHSDWVKIGKDFPIKDSKKYFEELNNLFDKIERTFSVSVLIAAHPKAEYSGNEFGGREIIFGKTAELIASSKFAIYLYGTSLTNILLRNRPFFHIYTSMHTIDNPAYKYIEKVNRILKTKLLSTKEISDSLELEEYINVPGDSMDKIISYYIVDSKSSKTDFEIIEQCISGCRS